MDASINNKINVTLLSDYAVAMQCSVRTRDALEVRVINFAVNNL